MKIKKVLKVFATSLVFSAVLTSCGLFSSSTNMKDYVEQVKSSQLTSFNELKLTSYSFTENAKLISGYGSDTYIVRDEGKYGLINLKTKKYLSARYDSAYESSTYHGLFYVTKMIDGNFYYGVANANGETDFSASYSSSISITSEGYIYTPQSYYHVKNSKITLIDNVNDPSSHALSMSGTRYFVDDYIINHYSNYNYYITVFKNLKYQHTFMLDNYMTHYIGDGRFILQKSEYLSDDLHNVTDYDYVTSSGSAYKLTTKIYDAKTNKVKKCSIDEPIENVEMFSNPAVGELSPFITAPKKESFILTTRRIFNRVLSNSVSNVRLVNSKLEVIAKISEGEKIMTSKVDDLTSYTDDTGMIFVKNKKNELIYFGDYAKIVHNNIIFRRYIGGKYAYGSITADGASVNAIYDELYAGPNALFGRIEDEYYRIDFDGRKTKLFDILRLSDSFYVKESSDIYEIISYGNPSKKISFMNVFQYNYNMGVETVLVTLEAGGANPSYFVGEYTI